MRREHALALGAAATVVAVLVMWPTTRKTALAVAEEPALEPTQEQAVLYIENGCLRVPSLDEWRSLATTATEDALRSGARNAATVLAEILRRALPRYPWPPSPDSTLWPQWRQMVEDVASVLHMDDDPMPDRGRPPLRVVRS